MSLFYQHLTDDVVLSIWKVDETTDELAGMLKDKTQLKISDNFKSLKRRSEWLAVRVLLQMMIGEGYKIAYYPTGRPYLVDAPYNISISHTDGYVAVIVSSTDVKVSIDIERRGDRVHRVVSKFLDSEELSYLSQSGGMVTKQLLSIWSAKESVYKLFDIPGLSLKEDIHIQSFMMQDSAEMYALVNPSFSPLPLKIYYKWFDDFVLTYIQQ